MEEIIVTKKLITQEIKPGNLIKHTAFSLEALQTATLTPSAKASSISLYKLITEIHQPNI